MASVSVIIPVYNQGRFIEESLSSVAAQSRPADEIIVVDDGSTDDTSDVVARCSIPGLRYIRQANAGVSAARNTGLEAASGDFVAFLDADDRWRPKMLESQVGVLLSHTSVQCVFSNFVRFSQDTILPDQFTFYPELQGIATRSLPRSTYRIVDGDAFSAFVSFGEIPAFTPVMAFRRRALDDLRFDRRLRLCEDTHFVLRAMLRGDAAFTSDVLAEVRRHGQNSSKDRARMPLYKLDALRAVPQEDLNAAQQAALHRRLSRAFLDAAEVHARERRLGQMTACLAHAWKAPGAFTSKTRGTAKVLSRLVGRA